MADYSYQKELQLLPSSPSSTPPPPRPPANPSPSSVTPDSFHYSPPPPPPSLDLQLSINVVRRINRQQSSDHAFPSSYHHPKSKTRNHNYNNSKYLEAMKCQAAEETRLATIERAYAARVQEISRREMEAAEIEFSKARRIWERAKEEVEKAEKLKERAKSNIGMNHDLNNDDASTCMEIITCHSCRHKFHP